MNIGELITIRTLEENENPQAKHTPYSAEIRLFSCVQMGDTDKLMSEFESIASSIITGKLSDDMIMQYKYLAVSIVTLATRYAIQGGLSEKIAYEFSDRVIMSVDGMKNKEEIILYVGSEIITLTELVKKSKLHPQQSPHVRKCMQYINENITSKISVSLLSDYCGISSDYLSQVFKDETGENLSSYIIRKKLEKAKELLSQGKSSKETCALLAFSSQSHFITSFRKYYHMTPTEYLKMIK